MSIVNVYGKGETVYGKHSSKLNLTSQRIDRRLKENENYRSSNPKEGELVKEDGKTYIVFEDGEKVKCEYQF